MRSKLEMMLVVAALGFTSSVAYADGMLLTNAPGPNIRLFEPRQQAVVAWNGTEEIMILRVEVRASKATEAIHVVPFPSEPKVSKGDNLVFGRLVDALNEDRQRRARKPSLPSKPSNPSMSEPAGEITLHDVVGVHEVTVVHVVSSQGFVEWVKSKMHESTAMPFVVPSESLATISDYLASGAQWFVFDRLQLPEVLSLTEPLEYRFETPRLYYPLRITKVSGASNVELTVLTRQTLKTFVGIEDYRVKLMHHPVDFPARALPPIDLDLGDLFKSSEEICLRLWQIKDYGHGFAKDLLAM